MPPTTAPFSNAPIRIPWDEVGDNLTDFYYQAASKVRDFLCDLHNRKPSGLTGNCQVLDNPLCRIAHSNWNRACAGRQSLPIPPPFVGGQCPIFYNVRMKISVRDLRDCTIKTFYDNTSTPQPIVGLGPLRGFFFDIPTNQRTSDCRQNQEAVSIRTLRFRDVGQNIFSQGNFPTTIPNFDGYYNFLDFIEITPRDGEPDNCGNLPISYPAEEPITEEDKRTTITINNTDGTSFDFDLTLIDFSTTTIFEYNLFLGDPNDPDQGGMGIAVDHNGISFDPGGTGSISPSDVGGGDNGDTCKPKKPELPDLEEEEGEQEEEDEGIEYVKIKLTKFPDRVSFGESLDRNNYYAGFFRWNIGGEGYTTPEYIMNVESIYEAPENTKGYTVSFRNGAEGIVTKLKISTDDNTNGGT